MNEIPADMWLHVATDALARWAAAGNTIAVHESDDGVMLLALVDVTVDDPRLSPAFVAGLKLVPAEVVERIGKAPTPTEAAA